MASSAGLAQAVTLVVTPKVAVPEWVLQALGSQLGSRLRSTEGAFRVDRVGDTIRITVEARTNAANRLDEVTLPGEVLFRPVLCTTGADTSAEITPFPPYDAPAGGSTATTLPGYSSNNDCQLAATTEAAALPSSTVDDKAAIVLLPAADSTGVHPDLNGARFLLGPAQLTGSAVASATAQPPDNTTSTTWFVQLTFTNAGSSAFNQLAQANYQQFVAIEVDGFVESTPQIQSQTYNGQAIVNGPDFNESEVKELALLLNSGSLPTAVNSGSMEVETRDASMGLRGFVAGASGIEVQVPDDGSLDPTAAAQRLHNAGVQSYDILKTSDFTLINIIGSKVNQQNVMGLLSIPSRQAIVSPFVVEAS